MDPENIDYDEIVERHPSAAGLAILIGNDYKQTEELGYLEGPKNDLDKADEVFSSFGGVCVRLWNKSAGEIGITIRKAASCTKYTSSYKWIVIIISGHGTQNAYFANNGQPVYLKDAIIDPFQPMNAPINAKLVKLIFIDACRGIGETNPVFVPRGQNSKGGKAIETMCFPPEGNVLVAYSTLPQKRSYELSDIKGGLWISKVLARLESTPEQSVLNILTMVNKDILHHYQDRKESQSIQQSILHSTLMEPFKFERRKL